MAMAERAVPAGPRLLGRLTAELIQRSPQYMSCINNYEIDLRGAGFDAGYAALCGLVVLQCAHASRFDVAARCCVLRARSLRSFALFTHCQGLMLARLNRRQQDRRHREPRRDRGAAA